MNEYPWQSNTTIHSLMNRSPVTADVEIRVFNIYRDRLIYDGKYEDSTPYIFGMDVDTWEIDGLKIAPHQSKPKITHMTIVTEVY